MLNELMRLAPPMLDARHYPSSWIEWLTLAQHHRMATRLLDWTDNALAALWFAVHEVKPPQVQPAVVWLLLNMEDATLYDPSAHTTDDDVLALPQTYLVRPSHVGNRMGAQSAWFTLHHSTNSAPRYEPLEDQSAFRTQTQLRRITLAPNWLPKIRYELVRCGVHAGTMFPELDGLCEHLNQAASQA